MHKNLQIPPSVVDLQLYRSAAKINHNIGWNNVTSLFLNGVKFYGPCFWPPNLTSLDIDEMADLSLDHLPSTLKKLYIGAQFNQPINNLPSPTSLTVSEDFNQLLIILLFSLTFILVMNLIILSIISHLHFNIWKLARHLITQLKTFHLLLKNYVANSSFNQKVNNLPPTITSLSLPLPSLTVLPNSISSLKIYPIFSQNNNKYSLYLPVNVKKFRIELEKVKECDVCFNFASWKMELTKY